MSTLKKLSKILPEDEIKVLEDEFIDMLKRAELKAKKALEAKEIDLKKK